MSDHDVVVLSEIHCANVKHAPGFIPVVAKNDSPTHRGGLVVLFKYHIYPEFYGIDKSVPEQVWFKLRCLPQVQFCGAYVAPSDSPYSCDSSLAEIQAKTTCNGLHYIIVGDLNARCGSTVQDLTSALPNSSYRPVDLSINNNGRDAKQLCIDNSLLILNNLVFDNKFYEGGMTFRRKKKWISELDLCILSPALLGYTERLHVSNDTKNPSDHAPVSVEFKFTSDLVSPHSILAKAETTDGHAVLMSDAYNQPLCRKPIPLQHAHTLRHVAICLFHFQRFVCC